MQQRLKIEFPGHAGDKLSARLDRPSFKPRAWALFAHCFSCSKDIHATRNLTGRLAELGIGVLSFDFTGLGNSEGDFANTNFSSNVQDLIAAANWLAETHGGPQLLIGHSLGGAAAIVAARHIQSVKAVATIGAPSDAEHVLHVFAPRLNEIETNGVATVNLGHRPFTIKKQFLDDVRGQTVKETAAQLKRPLLVLHAPLDAIVGIENATNLFVAAQHPKSFVSLDNADHLLSRESDAVYAADVISGWASRYIFDSGQAQPNQESRGSRDVVVTETGGGKYENEVAIGEHFLLADEPVEVGGGGRGPDPYEFVSTGLGACTSMTLRMYANRKKWPVERISVGVTHRKDYAADCENCEDKGSKIDVFTRYIKVVGDLDEVQRARMLEIADKCPVHKTMEANSLIETVEET